MSGHGIDHGSALAVADLSDGWFIRLLADNSVEIVKYRVADAHAGEEPQARQVISAADWAEVVIAITPIEEKKPE